MRIIETKVYTFDELSEEAKQKALENLAYINVEHLEWWEFTYEDAKRVGIKITGFDIDRRNECTGELLYDMEEVAENILKEHGEQCKTVAIVKRFLAGKADILDDAKRDENGDFEDEWEVDNLIDKLEKEILEDLLDEYLTILRNDYDYLISEEAIKETIEANEYEFLEDGTLN